MRTRMNLGVGLALALCAGTAPAQDVVWRAAKPPAAPAAPAARITLGQPMPLSADAPAPPPAGGDAPRVVRGQAGDIPPPPPAFPGAPAPYSVPPGSAPYNGGVVNSDADLGF